VSGSTEGRKMERCLAVIERYRFGDDGYSTGGCSWSHVRCRTTVGECHRRRRGGASGLHFCSKSLACTVSRGWPRASAASGLEALQEHANEGRLDRTFAEDLGPPAAQQYAPAFKLAVVEQSDREVTSV
jgi:hypothetical protein